MAQSPGAPIPPAQMPTERLWSELVPSRDGEFLDALCFHLRDGAGDYWLAVRLWRVREIKKFFKQITSLEELADDFVSSAYDPRGQRNVNAVYSLANVLQPRIGLLQTFGVRSFGRTMDEALALGAPSWHAMRAIFEGKFRQSVIEPLAIDDATHWLRHIRRCQKVGALLGHPVPRRIGAGGDLDAGGNRISSIEAAEQMEVVAAACAEIPFMLAFFVDPLHFSDITRLLMDVQRDLSKWKSEAQGSQSASVSMILPALAVPSFSYFTTQAREAGIGHDAAQRHSEQLADMQTFSRDAQAMSMDMQAQDVEAHRSVERTQDWERRFTTQSGSERVTEQGTAHETLDRVARNDWQLSKDWAATEQGVRAEQSVHTTATLGARQELSRIDEHAQAQEHRVVDNAYQGSEAENRRTDYTFGEEGSRNVQGIEAGTRNMNYSFGESASFGSDAQRVIHSNDVLRSENQGTYYDRSQGDYTEQRGSEFSQRQDGQHQSATSGGQGSAFQSNVGGQSFRSSDDSRNNATLFHNRSRGANIGLEFLGLAGSAESNYRGLNLSVDGGRSASQGFSNDQQAGTRSEQYNASEAGTRSDSIDGTRSDNIAGQRAAHTAGAQGAQVEQNIVRNFDEITTIRGTDFRSGGGSRSESYTNAYSRNETYQTGGQGWRDELVQRQFTGRRVDDMQIRSDIVSGIDRAASAQYADQNVQRSAGVTAWQQQARGTYDETGTRLDRVWQDDQRAWQSDVSRQFQRSVAQTTQGEGGVARQGTSEQISARAATEAAEVARMGRQLTKGPASSSDEVSRASNYQGNSRIMASGFGSAGAPSLIAGMGYSRMNYEQRKAFIAYLLEMQEMRLRHGQESGLFATHAYVGAYDESGLQTLAQALAAALREENVVRPVYVMGFEGSDAQVMRNQLWNFTPHRAPASSPLELDEYGTLLTADEVGAMVHPLRIDGSGGISTTVEAIPSGLATPAGMKGEMWWGWVVSPTNGRQTETMYRVSADALMHLTLVGGSGSGKSNSALHLLKQVFLIRQDPATKQRIPMPMVQTAQGHSVPDRRSPNAGQAAIGATVFDPTGEWRRMVNLLPPGECRFRSLTDPDLCPLRVNPLQVPSPYIEPSAWAEILAKRWALAYATGASGYYALKRAILDLYKTRGVIDAATGRADWRMSAQLCMRDLHDRLADARGDLGKTRSKQDITIGVIDRILEKMQDYLPDSGSRAYRMFGTPNGCTVDDFMPESVCTVLEGRFEDDGMKVFIIGLLGAAAFAHAAGRWEALGHDAKRIPQHILVFEEAHEVMESDESGSEMSGAVEKGASLWNKMFDQGRKYGLYIWGIGQRLKALPAGLLSSSRILIVQSIDEQEDIQLAVTKLGFVSSGVLEDVVWTKFLQRLEQGRGVVRFARLPPTKSGALPDLMRPTLVQFPQVFADAPSDDDLRALMGKV